MSPFSSATPRSLLAQPVCERIDAQTGAGAEAFLKRTGRKPRLVALWVGENTSSEVYIRRKSERAALLGMIGDTQHFGAATPPAQVRQAIEALNRDPSVDGILLQRPLPSGFSESELIHWIAPQKDVDCFHPENVGLLGLGAPRFAPCTPAGVMELLAHYKIAIAGTRACVVGRSPIVGRPMAQLLLQHDATVTIAHSKSKDLPSITRDADLLIVAAGRAGLIGREHVKSGAVVIDVGIHRDDQNRLTGDVRAAELHGIASALSPVPGGVGPLTISVLFQNTLRAAELASQERQHP